MTKEEAGQQLKTGYSIAIVAFVLFLLFSNGGFSDRIYVAFIAAYWSWGTYWGIKIMYPIVSGIFRGSVYYKNLWDSVKGQSKRHFWYFSVMLLLGCIGIVLHFEESSNMEHAYGLAIYRWNV